MATENLVGTLHPRHICSVCGSSLYCTDHGNHELTYHCSSGQARFWDFERGTPDQEASKSHWDRSRLEEFQKKQ